MSNLLQQLLSNDDSQAIDIARLRRYLSPTLLEALDEQQEQLSANLHIEAFVHLASVRYAITTYISRIVLDKVLQQRLNSPWLSWQEGSLLFADLSGSTALADNLGSLGREGIERVTEFLNEIFTALIAIILQHGGDLLAFGGDALLVFFNDSKHAHTAVQAAQALQAAMHGKSYMAPGIGDFAMHLHMGIESGPVAFVSAGAPHALYYSTLGATVNRVALAEVHAQAGEIVIGPASYAQLNTSIQSSEVAPGYRRVEGLLSIEAHIPRPTELEPAHDLGMLLDDLERLSAYMPNVLFQRILSDPQRPRIEAELRPVTVMFMQIIGLEELIEQLSTEAAAALIQHLFVPGQEIIERYGGVVNKVDVADQGIKLVAMFGAPIAYEDHTERAARAALALHDYWSSYNDQPSTTEIAVTTKQRIGINLGTVFAGNVGSPERKEYTVMGDAVNVAARVMSAAPWYEIWCSEAVAQSIEAHMRCEPRTTIQLKGKATSNTLYQLLAERDLPLLLSSSETALVGRENELTWLQDQLRHACAGQGRVVRIIGEAGVGKSRLSSALLQSVQSLPVCVTPVTCFSYTASIPYWAWSEWLKVACGIQSEDDQHTRIQKLSVRLEELGPGMEEWLGLMGELIRLDVAESPRSRGLDPQSRQEQRFEIVERLVLRNASEQPLVIIFENLQWVDSVSLELWKRLSQRIQQQPVLMLGIHRSSSQIDDSDNANVLNLGELTASESHALITTLAGGYTLAEPVVHELISRSAGNPLFLVELLRVLMDRINQSTSTKAIPSLTSRTQSASLSLLDDLPASLNGLLLSRVDRLDEASRSVLRMASVIGQRIPFGVLRSIQPADQRMLLRQLTRLDQEEITYTERTDPERVHVFRHALVQEVTYQSMLYARRRELHGRIGEYLEQEHEGALDDYYGLLAHHYRLSDRSKKAIHYLMLAGNAARNSYANEEALQYYRWAIEIIDNPADAQTWECLDAIGEVYEVIGRYDQALAQHQAIIDAPNVHYDIARRAHRKSGSVLERQGNYTLALAELDRALNMAFALGSQLSPLSLPRTYADIAQVRQRLGDYDLAIEACHAGLNALRTHSRMRYEDLIEADLHSILGGIYGMRGEFEHAQHHFESSLHARIAAEDIRGRTVSHNNLGYLWQLQNDYQRALEQYAIVEELATTIHMPHLIIFAHTNAAFALISLGRYEEAETRCYTALELSSALQTQQTTAQIYNTLSIIYTHQGRYQEALEMSIEAQQLNHELSSVFEEANALLNMARTLIMLQRFSEAAQAAEHVYECAKSLQSQRLLAESILTLAEIHLGLGKLAEASQALDTVSLLAKELNNQQIAGITLRLRGILQVVQGQDFNTSFTNSILNLKTIKHSFELARSWAAYGIALFETGNKELAQTYLKQSLDTFTDIGAHGEQERIAHYLLKGELGNVTA